MSVNELCVIKLRATVQIQPSAISATLATQNEGPCKRHACHTTKVDVAKCHACHAKCRGVTGD